MLFMGPQVILGDKYSRTRLTRKPCSVRIIQVGRLQGRDMNLMRRNQDNLIVCEIFQLFTSCLVSNILLRNDFLHWEQLKFLPRMSANVVN